MASALKSGQALRDDGNRCIKNEKKGEQEVLSQADYKTSCRYGNGMLLYSLRWSYLFVFIFSLIDLMYPIDHSISASTFIVNFSVLSLAGQTHLSRMSNAAFMIPNLFCVAKIVFVNEFVLTHLALSTPLGGNQ
jgi:hypothetical protein